MKIPKIAFKKQFPMVLLTTTVWMCGCDALVAQSGVRI